MNSNYSSINKKQLGKKIKFAREEHNYTQYQLACLIGVSSNFFGDVERGNKLPSLETLVRLSNALKISMDFLLSDSLQNFVEEDDSIVYTNKQMAILKNIVKSISDNF